MGRAVIVCEKAIIPAFARKEQIAKPIPTNPAMQRHIFVRENVHTLVAYEWNSI